ncbi:hypothetical protein EG349_01980 [Chryseobacterium shandongense]|uniref:PepSY domain-containing protein n=1 Tax=Chryseobacterium shandongense TaxID=1493872 RepID=A0AAD0YC47_9FLAO|nr:PepSY domain-containing protein [Chryseobacterium shandongense]AZA85644.1 hypothetical protein EG349_01980 [Chryseobacterium shandongense]
MKLQINALLAGCLLSYTILSGQQSSLENPARNWITQNSRNIGLQDFSTLKLSFVRKGNSGETLRFQQMIGNIPVFQSEIVMHFNKNGQISYTATESFKKNVQEINTEPAVSSVDALKKAHISSHSKGDITFEEAKLYVFVTDQNETKLVYRVLTSSYENPGSWETIIDAKTGEVISVKDISFRHKEKEKPEKIKNTRKLKKTCW